MESSQLGLSGKTVVVTDASSQLGAGVAITAAALGATVVANRLADRAYPPSRVGTIKVIDEDVTAMPGAQRLVAAGLVSSNMIDVLVNSCQVTCDRPVAEMTERDWDGVIDGTLRPLFLCTSIASELMYYNRAGRIINCAATEGLSGVAVSANSSAAQAAIAAFTRVVRRDLGPFGITVNLIAVPRDPDPATTETAAVLVAFLGASLPVVINGQHFLVSGRTISLLRHPVAHTSLFCADRWTQEELSRLMPTLNRSGASSLA